MKISFINIFIELNCLKSLRTDVHTKVRTCEIYATVILAPNNGSNVTKYPGSQSKGEKRNTSIFDRAAVTRVNVNHARVVVPKNPLKILNLVLVFKLIFRMCYV